jgi:hypothetical protein
MSLCKRQWISVFSVAIFIIRVLFLALAYVVIAVMTVKRKRFLSVPMNVIVFTSRVVVTLDLIGKLARVVLFLTKRLVLVVVVRAPRLRLVRLHHRRGRSLVSFSWFFVLIVLFALVCYLILV